MLTTKFIKKIVLYSYIYDNINYTNTFFLKELVTFIKIICRQSPSLVFNKKNEVLAVKTTLRKDNLNIFLYKLINFTLPKIQKNLLLNENNCKLDNNYNLNILLRNKRNFFEYKTSLISNFNCIFNINLIFNDNINTTNKLDYINNTLNIKL